jgi:alpha-galactosidase
MIAPFQMTSVRAVLWALDLPRSPNSTTGGVVSANTTACYFRAMINGWRDAMPVGDFAFLFAQTAVVDSGADGLAAASVAIAQSNALPGHSTLLGNTTARASPFQDTIDVDTTGMVTTADLDMVDANGRATVIALRFALALVHVAFAEQPASDYIGPVLAGAEWLSTPHTQLMHAGVASWSLKIRFASSASGRSIALRLVPAAGCTSCCSGARPVDTRVCHGVEPDDLNGCVVATTVVLSPDNTSIVASFDAPAEGMGTVVVLMSSPAAQCSVAYAGSNTSSGVSAVVIDVASASVEAAATAAASPHARVNGGLLFGTPAMGWNAWNAFHCDVSERLVVEMADAMVATGLAKAGYKYINLDDCWMVQRAANGTIVADPSRFPSGIKKLADYVHSKGLFFGIYQAPAATTPQSRPGLLGHEEQDVDTFCEWGVDYIKLDSKGSTKTSWHLVREAIDRCKHPMWLQVAFCETVASCQGWMDSLANSWRTSGDAQATWASVTENARETVSLWPLAGPTGPIGGHWNDADLLEVGNVGLTPLEMKTQIALWSFMNSPLLTSFDLRKLLQPDMAVVRGLLTNPGMVALNQDPLGYAGRAVQAADVTNGGLARTSVVVAACDDGLAQQQFVIDTRNGTLVHMGSGLALTVPNCATSEPSHPGAGVPVTLEPLGEGGGNACGGLNQRWTLQSNGTITSRMTLSSTSQCLDVYAHVNPVQLHFCVRNPDGGDGPPESEAWKVVRGFGPNNATFTIRWGKPDYDKCMQGSEDPAPPSPPPPPVGGEVWQKQLAGGDVALLLVNWADVAAVNITVNFGLVPGLSAGSRTARVRDVWTGADEGVAKGGLWRVVQPHDATVLRLTPAGVALWAGQ